MQITLSVVVSAIVILITALVIITIFGQSIGNISTLTEATTRCSSEAEITCRTTNSMPITWDVNTVRVDDGIKSCALLTTCVDCSCITGDQLVGDLEQDKFYAGEYEGSEVGIELPDNSIAIAMANLPSGIDVVNDGGSAYA